MSAATVAVLGRWSATRAALIVVALAACSGSDASPQTTPDATQRAATQPAATQPATSQPDTTQPDTTPPDTTATTVDPRSVDLRGLRYCEVLLVTIEAGSATADVYNSYPLNDCPAEQWQQLDATAIAAQEDAVLAILNGPRYWLMNRIEKAASDDQITRSFGGIAMIRRATVEVGDIKAAAIPYTPHAVDRKTVFTFDAGMEVYELTAADGTVYVMQTYSQQNDPTLVETDLAGLGARLVLPAGWTFSSRTLIEPLAVNTLDAPAMVLQLLATCRGLTGDRTDDATLRA
jgi:hypothetical protein